MKIILNTADSEDPIAWVHDNLVATLAQHEFRQLDSHLAMFSTIVWENIDIGIGTDPFWNYAVLANRRDRTLLLWARSNEPIADDKREPVEQVLLSANIFSDLGSFSWVDGDNLIQFTRDLINFDDLQLSLLSLFSFIENFLAIVTPVLEKTIDADGKTVKGPTQRAVISGERVRYMS